MSDRQWAALMQADESYAGSHSYARLKKIVCALTGFEHFIPTHQGRAAENILFSALVKPGDIVPGNAHFDTTKGHIEYRKAIAVDCTVDTAYDPDAAMDFKGNIDLNKLEACFKKYPPEKIPFVLLTITCNSVGGQPVSLANIQETRTLCDHYGKRLFIDAARFAENAYFIKTREPDYAAYSIPQIVKAIFDLADGMTMSAKKDGLVNMGGFVALREKSLYNACSVFCILFEGFVTYGGLSGRDMEALAVGLKEVVDFHYLESRIREVHRLGEQLATRGIPLQKPFGGHAIFLDALQFFPHIPREEFPAQLLATALYETAGIRTAEIGTLLADRDPKTRQNRFPKLELLRLAIPRRTYSCEHLDYVVEAVIQLYENRYAYTRGYAILWEAPILRHFTVRLARL